MYRYPSPLNAKALRALQTDRRYWDSLHPERPAFHAHVTKGFELVYPGPMKLDATGRRIDQPGRELRFDSAGRVLSIDGKPPRAGGAVRVRAHKLDTGGREGGVELSWQATSDGGQAKATFGYTTSWTPITEEIEFDVNGIHYRKAAPPRYLSDNTILGTLRLARSFVGDAFRHVPCVCQGWGVCG